MSSMRQIRKDIKRMSEGILLSHYKSENARLRKQRDDLRAAARAVVESREEIHSLEAGEGYLVCGAAIDALRALIGGPSCQADT